MLKRIMAYFRYPRTVMSPKRQVRAGWALIDTLLAVGLSAIMASDMALSISDIRQRQVALSMADAVNTIAPITQRYIEQNYQTLTSIIGVGSTQEVPLYNNQGWNGIGDVATSSALPSGWVPRLLSGQSVRFYVKHVPALGLKPEHLVGLLMTVGGNPLTDKQAGVAALSLKGMGGGVMRHRYGSNNPNTLIGLSGAWSQTASDWPGALLSYGHVGVLVNGATGTIQPYLNRYNIGNSEANRLHTSVDVNGNDLNNVRAMTGVNAMRITGTGGAVNFHGGINTCLDNQTGCGISISDDGGFYDYNDCWITLTSAYGGKGLHLSGSNNGSGNLWADGWGKFGGRLASFGFDPNDLPTLTSGGGWGGGLRTLDVVAEATIAATHGGANNLAAVMNNAGFRLGDHLDAWNYDTGHTVAAMRSNGDIYADRRIGSLGYQPGQGDPSGWGGGLSTWDVVSHGSIAAGVDNEGNANVFLGGWSENDKYSHGNIKASERVQGQVLRPTYIATQGQSCSGVSYGEFGNHYQYNLMNGDIATDSHGSLMSCVDGTWQYAGGKQFSNMIWQHRCGTWSGYNPTSQSRLEILEIHAGHKGATAGGFVNGSEVAYVEWSGNKGRVSQTMTFIVPPYSNWHVEGWRRVDDVCQTEFE